MQKRRFGMVLCILAAGFLCGCVAETQEGDKIVLIEQEAPPVEYAMGVTIVTDVVATKNVSCVYRQVSDWNGSFEISGRQVAKVYVEKGDTVTEGQLLAELDMSSTEQAIAKLEYKISRNKVLLEYLEQTRDYEIQKERMKYENYPGWEEWQEKTLEEAEAEIRLSYQYQIEDCMDEIVADEAKLPELKEECTVGKLYAGMSGIVSYIRSSLEGSYTWENQTVLTIMDNSQCVFEVNEPEYARYFIPSSVTKMSIAVGEGKGDYLLTPYAMDDWGETLLFSIAGNEDESMISLGDSGTMKVVTGEKLQVLAVPADAVHKADGREFVYVVGDSGLRELKWISTGLHGKDYVEVFEGLVEGEKVVLR